MQSSIIKIEDKNMKSGMGGQIITVDKTDYSIKYDVSIPHTKRCIIINRKCGWLSIYKDRCNKYGKKIEDFKKCSDCIKSPPNIITISRKTKKAVYHAETRRTLNKLTKIFSIK
jgi:hypothetical protein